MRKFLGRVMAMSKTTYEGVIENGQVKLEKDAVLPEHAKVLVVVLDPEPQRVFKMMSPRLVHREQAKEFEKIIVKE